MGELFLISLSVIWNIGGNIGMAGRRFYVEMVGAAGTGWGCNVTAGYLVYRGLNDYLNVEGTMGWVHRDFTLRLSCMRRISYINWAHSRYIIGGSGIVIDEILNIFSFNHPLVGICTDVRMGDFVLGKVPVYLRAVSYTHLTLPTTERV